MKKIIFGLVLGLVLGASGSVMASIMTTAKPVPTMPVPNTQTIKLLTPAPVGAKAKVEAVPVVEFDSFTGKKLSAEEKRMRTLEARVSALEAKLK